MGQTGNAHRIIVALDVGTRSQALSLVESLPEEIVGVKNCVKN